MSENSNSWLLAAFADPARELWGLVSGGPERHVAVGRLQSPATGGPLAYRPHSGTRRRRSP